jgi:malonyl-CoA/methylmalonyl-CoA synthetase
MINSWKWSSSDRILHVLPLHHVHGVVNALLTPLWAGATCQMLSKFDAKTVWTKFISQNTSSSSSASISVFMAVPTVYQKLITEYEHLSPEEQRLASAACAHMRLQVSGSMALPEPIFNHWATVRLIFLSSLRCSVYLFLFLFLFFLLFLFPSSYLFSLL